MSDRQKQQRSLRASTRVWVAGVLLVFGVGAYVAAVARPAGAAQTTQASPLSLPQVIDLALTNSLDMKIANVTLDNAKVTYEKAKANALASGTPYDQQSAESNWQAAQRSFRTSQGTVTINAANQYLSLITSQLNLKVAQAQRDAAEQAYKLAQARQAAKTAGPFDVLNAEASLRSAEANLAKLNDSYAEAVAALQQLLGVNNLQIPETYPVIKLPALPKLEDAIATAQQNSETVASRRRSLDLAQLQHQQDLLEDLAPLDRQASENNLNLAQLNYDKALADIAASVTSAYHALVQSQNSLQLAQQNYEIEQQKYAITQQQAKAGIKTQSDLNTAQTTLWQRQADVQSATTSYLVNWLKFQQTIGMDQDLAGMLKGVVSNAAAGSK
ncbi:MAG: TolC family protein [Limnochordaceae bacterium]|nr:TolC family protein [Limnochordaceae bacterium]